jgi:TrmH family RNA methyltransferase
VRELHQAKGRREQGLLLLEGTHLLQECERLAIAPTLLIATSRWLERHPELALLGPLQAVTPEVLEAMATTTSPDGVLALLSPPAAATLPAAGPQPMVLALDRVQDPGNLGTLMRTALAAGVEQLWLGGGADPWQPKVLRASAGAALELPLKRLESLEQCLGQAKADGWSLRAAVRQGGVPYWQLDWRQACVLVLGNEGAGIDPALERLGLEPVTIPHSPQVESLNVAVAAGVLLLERQRQGWVAAADRGESSAIELGR